MPMISLQVSKNIINEIDKLQTHLGFSSRSQTLRKCITNFIQQTEKEYVTKGHKIANIVVNHEKRADILDLFSEISQKYENIIKSINQYNLEHRIIKTIIVAGNGEEINDLFHIFESERLFKTTLTYIVVPEE